MGTLLFNLNPTSRPLPPSTLTLRYRLYDYDDMTDELMFPGHVVNDRTLVERASDVRAVQLHEAERRIRCPVAVRAAGGARRRGRLGALGPRRAPRGTETNEYLLKLALDATPTDWLTGPSDLPAVVPSASPSYNTFAHIAHTVVEEPTPDEQAQGQSVLLRKFDEADRNRQRLDLLLRSRRRTRSPSRPPSAGATTTTRIRPSASRRRRRIRPASMWAGPPLSGCR